MTNNVRRGDWGEVLASSIASFVYEHTVPLSKLRWKNNNDKSMFCTDLLTHNSGEKIIDLHYWEVKIRGEIKRESGKYVCCLAHESLLKDKNSPKEGIADLLVRQYYDKEDFENADRYMNIVRNPNSYNKNFEICIIVEHTQMNKIIDVINELSNLPPALEPLRVTIVWIENLATLIEKTFAHSEAAAIKYVYQS